MEAVLFIGIQATGKSSFFRARFFDTHVRISLDVLRTRHRERLLTAACIDAKARFVVDNTNASVRERARFIDVARAGGFRVRGFYFCSALAPAMVRNAGRAGRARIPDAGVWATYARLEVPTISEGFDELRYVRIDPAGGFEVEEWSDEVHGA